MTLDGLEASCSSWTGAFAYTGCRENIGLHQPGVDPHAVPRLVSGRPVRGTAARAAGMKLDIPSVPRVDRSGALRRDQAHLSWRIVRPQRASLPAVRAGAFRYRFGRRVDLHHNRAAMTRCLD